MIFDFFYLLGVSLSIITSLLILFKINTNRLLQLNLLGLYFLFNGITFMFYLFIQHKIILHFPYLYKVPAPLTFLIAPLGYLYVRTTLYNEEKLKKSDLWHFVIFVFFCFNYTDFYFMNLNEKKIIVENVVNNFDLSYNRNDGLVPEWINLVTRILQSIFYLVLMGILLQKFYKKNKIGNHFQKIKKWLYIFYRLQLGYWMSLFLIYVLINHNSTFYGESVSRLLINSLVSVFFFFLSAYLIFNPQVLLGLSYSMINSKNPEKGDNDEQHQFSNLNRFLNEQLLFTNPSITAIDIANKLNISQRSMFIAISDQGFNNFNDYINSLRHAYFLELLKTEDLNKFNLMTIAEKAGFNSSSSFYRTFKKHTKITPKEYLQQKS